MGGGSWTTASYVEHSTVTRGFADMDSFKSASTSQLYKNHSLDPSLDPKGVIRECFDSEEHPNSLPVILAVDVTGSMGSAASAVAIKLGDIMEKLFAQNTNRDIEFCIMAIGDQEYDHAPYQASQFESDIRIAQALEKIYFEGGGGGNVYESYVGAWLWAYDRTMCDCWSRGGRGVLITLGDEKITGTISNKYRNFIGENTPSDPQHKDFFTQFPVSTSKELYNQISELWDIYHISVNDVNSSYKKVKDYYDVDASWKAVIGQNYQVCTIPKLDDVISKIILNHIKDEESTYQMDTEISVYDGGGASDTKDSNEVVTLIGGGVKVNENGEVIW